MAHQQTVFAQPLSKQTRDIMRALAEVPHPCFLRRCLPPEGLTHLISLKHDLTRLGPHLIVYTRPRKQKGPMWPGVA